MTVLRSGKVQLNEQVALKKGIGCFKRPVPLGTILGLTFGLEFLAEWNVSLIKVGWGILAWMKIIYLNTSFF